VSLGEAVQVICTECGLTANELQLILDAVTANRSEWIKIACLLTRPCPYSGQITLNFHAGHIADKRITMSLDSAVKIFGDG